MVVIQITDTVRIQDARCQQKNVQFTDSEEKQLSHENMEIQIDVKMSKNLTEFFFYLPGFVVNVFLCDQENAIKSRCKKNILHCCTGLQRCCGKEHN